MNVQLLVELEGRLSKQWPLLERALAGYERPVALRRLPARQQTVAERLGPKLVEQVATEYVAGATTRQLMARYGMGKGSVLRLLRSQGVVMRKGR